MIRSTFLGFETAKRALSISQAGLDIVGHNISNAQTAGYTRQRVDQVSMTMNGMSSKYATHGAAHYGAGSSFKGVTQLRDTYLDNRYRAEATNSGELGVRQDGLTDINNIFDETTTDGLFAKMSDLLNSITVLGSSANLKENAMIVRDTADQLAQILNKNASQLEDARANQMLDLKTTVTQDVNTTLEKIAMLNKQIKDDNIYGNPSNELNDERNLLLDKLSEYLDIKIVRTPTKISDELTVETVSIELNNSGYPPQKLVDGEFANQLGVTEDPATGNAIVSLIDGISGMPLVENINDNLHKGGLKGYLDIINGTGPNVEGSNTYRGIPYYMAALDEYAQLLADAMNRINNISDQESADSGANYAPVLTGTATSWVDSITYGSVDFGGKNTNMSFTYNDTNNPATLTATFTDENGVTQSHTSDYIQNGKMIFGSNFTITTKDVPPPKPIPGGPPTTEMLIDAGWPPVTSTGGNKNLLVVQHPPITDSSGNQPAWIDSITGGTIQFSGKDYDITFDYNAGGYDSGDGKGVDPTKTMKATMKDANGNDVTYYGTYNGANSKVDFRDANGSVMFSLKTTSETPPASTVTNVDAKISAKNISVSQNWKEDPLYITTTKSNAPDQKQAALVLDGTKNPTWLDKVSMGPDAVAVPNGAYQFYSEDNGKTIKVKINGIVYEGEYKKNATINLKGGDPEKTGITLVTNSKAFGANDSENVATIRNDTGAKNDNVNKFLTELNNTATFEVSGIKANFSKFLTSFQEQMGLDKNLNTTRLESSVAVITSFSDRRDSISAVSIDEEGINMMTYQNYYNAAARYMTTLDEALDKIINGMGTVGR